MGIIDKLDGAPTPYRLIPAVAGGLLAAYSLGVVKREHVLLIALAFALALALLAAIHRIPVRRGRPLPQLDFYCYKVEVVQEEGLEKLRKFLEDRSASSEVRFTLLEEYERGGRSTILRVEGSPTEASLVESVASLVLGESLRLVRIEGACDQPGERGDDVREGLILLGLDMSRPVPTRFYLTRRDIEGHIGVFGSTGSGKSTTLRVIAIRAPESFRVLVLDWTGEHAEALAGHGFRIVDPSGGDLGLDLVSCGGLRRDEIVDILGRALDLSEPQAYLLGVVLERGAGSLRDVLEAALEWGEEESRWEREVRRALARRIGSLIRVSGQAFAGCNLGPLQSGRRLVVDLSSVADLYSRRALANILLSLLFLEVRRSRGDPVIVIVDEAQNLVSEEGRDIVNMILAESRKYGLHLVYATQSPSLIGHLALLNSNTKIVHSIKSQRDKKVIAETLGLAEDWAQALDKLPRGRAIVQSPSHPQPVLVAIKPQH